MAQNHTEKIWHNGKFIDWDQATIHVMSHVVHYASSLFEGIRSYETSRGPAIFRLKDHMQRLLDSCHIYRMEPPYSLDELMSACVELVRLNRVRSCYIRPVVFRGYGSFGINPFPNPIESYIVCWEWGRYYGVEALEQGVDVCVSSWTRISPNTLPAMAKSAANYMNSQLFKMEAMLNDYAEAIALDASGNVSEGSTENLFLALDNIIYTPPLASSILLGITRDTVMTLCRLAGMEIREQVIPREMLYIADEIFMTGTAAEVTPIRSVDKITVGNGQRGPLTKPEEWLTFVES
jgi:branched-chain amino acid aminotransferase